MNKIDELYELAGIEKIELSYPDNIDPFYPEFTEEKQLKLIKFLACRDFGLEIHTFCEWKIKKFGFSQKTECAEGSTFEEALANLIIKIWKYLDWRDIKKVKNILK